ncbi:hemin uptake protein HemP [Natronospira proteinivora]|uniref:Hemin uptake protein HemP n=1 Tax=Natronospira proteinivora TaxID=1807133 RepID=A0ABT1G8D6_9GAMM|nr:hemin uptake protein HemP [Natronospira proteinivora]MCP1727586.1 hemin uptake protein HemP [Natronospira proteinivora]
MSEESKEAERPAGPSPKSTDRHPPRRINSEWLLGQSREVIIRHRGREYHLRMTRSGKLILN